MNTLTVKPILLPQNKQGWNKGDIITITNNQLMIATYDSSGIDNWQTQYLYFTSSEEIKEGDWFIWQSAMHGTFEVHKYHSDAGYGMKTWTSYNKKDNSSLIVNWSGSRGKIVASTDTSLGLPSIPTSFLQQYVDANGAIESVELEMLDDYVHGIGIMKQIGGTKLKLTPNNEIIIADITMSDSAFSLGTPRTDNQFVKISDIQPSKGDKELEDAAIHYADEHDHLDSEYHAFKAGANWYKQKIINQSLKA